MRDVITLHVGQAGCQIGNACWELYCVEHGLLPGGYRTQNKSLCSGVDFIDTFFEETQCGRYVPRSVLVDLEPTVMDEIRNNQYRNLYNPDRLISGKEDAANNFARGKCTLGREIHEPVIEQMRLMAETSDSLAGFFSFNSFGGGTGSGLTSLLMDQLEADFDRKTKLQFSIYPSPRLSTAVVEPYNGILTSHATMDQIDCCFLMDNEALYNVCSANLDMDMPAYTDINRVVANVISAITSPLRFSGTINVDLAEFQTNLVPYPRVHFPITSYAPLACSEKSDRSSYPIMSITQSVFSRNNQMVMCDTSKGKYMACCMLYRGLINPNEVVNGISFIKSKLKFTNWCPTGFKVGINFQPPTVLPCSNQAKVPAGLCMIANSTSIAELWARLDYKFDLMFAKRAFIHWYLGEGMEEEDFTDARTSLASLEKDYEECGRDSEAQDTKFGEASTSAPDASTTTSKPA